MAALVDFTALTPDTGFKDGYPIAGGPVDGLTKDFWRKVRLDFSKHNLALDDWAKIMVIPAHTYVFDIMTFILQIDGAQNIVLGDGAGDGASEWIAAAAVGVAGVLTKTLVGDTNGPAGKYYDAAGALYLSPAGVALDTLIIDVYVHCMMIDQITN